MARKKRHNYHAEEDDHIDETWLIPYSDLLTLLLALFIVLFSMRAEDKAKTEAMMEALYKAFNTIPIFETQSSGQPISLPSSPGDTLPKPKDTEVITLNKDEQKLQDLMKKLQQYIDTNHLNAEITLTDSSEGIQISLKDKIIFDSGSDQLRTSFIPILNDISLMLKTVNNSIVVEGHTDNQPIKNSIFPSNWELSAARALSVVHYFQNHQINPSRLRFSGYGEFKPIYPNDSEKHREANRRVNIIILR